MGDGQHECLTVLWKSRTPRPGSPAGQVAVQLLQGVFLAVPQLDDQALLSGI
ncbi:hypothetical protein [Deinococcus altitudinis]|uniref:hypothetical protein n=1 Tax=Deinococcus altitudinis TaxID=468914 RepID=UPI003892097D